MATEAIILLAGTSSRLANSASVPHKALSRVGGVSLLGRLLCQLEDVGVQRIIAVTGHAEAEVRDHIAALNLAIPLHTVKNAAFRETNNLVSLNIGLGEVAPTSDVLVFDCDLVLQSHLIEQLVNSRQRGAALVSRATLGVHGTLVSVDDGRIADFVIRPTALAAGHRDPPELDLARLKKTVNAYRFSSSLWQELKPHLERLAEEKPNSYFEEVFQVANVKRLQIEAIDSPPDSWAEIDDVLDFEPAVFSFVPAQRRSLADARMGGYWRYPVEDFSYMCNPFFPTDGMFAYLRSGIEQLTKTYCSSQDMLNELTAALVGTDPAGIELLNGATQAYPLLHQEFSRNTVHIPSPTFGEYSRLFTSTAPYRDDPGSPLDLEPVFRAANPGDAVVVVNPNNPTGTLLESEQILLRAAENPEVTVIVDESFIAFTGHTSVLELLRSRPLENVVVLCSLSKSLGVPGLRLGYIYSRDDEFVSRVRASLPIWNVSSLAEYLLQLTFKHQVELKKSYEMTRLASEDVARELGGLEIVQACFNGARNFVLVELNGDTSAARIVTDSLLRNHRILIKDVSPKFPDGTPRLRVAVKDGAANARLFDALDRSCAQLGPMTDPVTA